MGCGHLVGQVVEDMHSVHRGLDPRTQIQHVLIGNDEESPKIMILYGSLWIFMDFYFFLIDFYDSLWIFVDLHGFLCFLNRFFMILDLCGSSLIFMFFK